MKKNSYGRLMEHIPVPQGLNERVLQEVRREEARGAGPRHLKRGRSVLRPVVCAACAMALVLGGLYLRPAPPATGEHSGSQGQPVTARPAYSFGLTAYAAETGEALAMEGGKLAFSGGNGHLDAKNGHYTGLLFRVEGEGVETVSISLDRGGIYRARLLSDMTQEEIQEFHEAQERGELGPGSVSRTEDGTWIGEDWTVLGSSCTEAADESVRYGFWVPPTGETVDPEADIRQQAWDSIDSFDGATMTLTVTFVDGSSQTQTYALRTGRLLVEFEEDGSQRVLPQLVSEDQPFVYGVYAELQA